MELVKEVLHMVEVMVLTLTNSVMDVVIGLQTKPNLWRRNSQKNIQRLLKMQSYLKLT
jgi:hypothetical protein